jgi:uncharacterized integral membrane protein
MAEKLTSMSQVRLIVVLIIGAAAVILAFQNRDLVDTKFLTFETKMPQFALLLLTAGCAFVAGVFAGTLRRRKK